MVVKKGSIGLGLGFGFMIIVGASNLEVFQEERNLPTDVRLNGEVARANQKQISF